MTGEVECSANSRISSWANRRAMIMSLYLQVQQHGVNLTFSTSTCPRAREALAQRPGIAHSNCKCDSVALFKGNQSKRTCTQDWGLSIFSSAPRSRNFQSYFTDSCSQHRFIKLHSRACIAAPLQSQRAALSCLQCPTPFYPLLSLRPTAPTAWHPSAETAEHASRV